MKSLFAQSICRNLRAAVMVFTAISIGYPAGRVAAQEGAIGAADTAPTFAALAPDEPDETDPIFQQTGLAEAVVAPPPPGAADAGKAKAAAALKKKKEALKKAVAGAYKPVFYDNNFTYLESPLYGDWFVGDRLKRNRIGNLAVIDVGGQYRMRFHSEQNMRGFGLTGVDDNFLLQRTRLFANLQVGDNLRVYSEMLDAVSNFEHAPPRIIEENRMDILNLFADLTLLDGTSGNLKFRGGRQELLYGAERLVSPLDWANTRRTFEGYKFLWVGEDWNIDAFYTRPVLVNPTRWDSPDYKEEFSGIYSTYKAVPNNTFDLYWFGFYNNRGANHFKYDTVGGRWLGSKDSLLWEFESGMQYGDNTSGSDHWGTFATAGLGKKMEERSWKPTLWGYFDYASGGARRGAGEGFNHLFPLAHKYLGFMDLFGRSNICTPNAQLVMQPHEKLKALIWYYYFFLQDGRDTPYNVNMTAFNPGNAPASRDLGHELDLLFTYTLNPRMDLVFGYSHFFSGNYYKLTPGVPYRGDADFVYTQYQWNF